MGNSPESVWFKYADFWSKSDCQQAGEELVAGGLYKGWACYAHGLWELWVLD